MKLNKLTSAVSISLAALALTACGSDNNTSQTPSIPAPGAQTPTPDPAPTPDPTPDPAPTPDTGAPNQQGPVANNPNAEIKKENPVAPSYDTSIASTNAMFNYVRDDQSNYDRISNPAKTSGVSLNSAASIQNPWLSNFTLATEINYNNNGKYTDKSGRKFDVWGKNYLGEYVNANKNKEEVQVTAKSYTTTGVDGTVTPYDVPQPVDNRITIQEENVKNVSVTYAEPFMVGVMIDKYDIADGAHKASKSNRPFNKAIFEQLKSDFSVDKIRSNNAAVLQLNKFGLVGYKNGVKVFGMPEDDILNLTTTQVFGKNYKALESANIGTQTSPNSYRATYTPDGKLANVELLKLDNVQYGRLTANVDALAANPFPNADGRNTHIYRPFTNKQTQASVDNYFARGTNPTSAANMLQVKTANPNMVLQYLGHARTYGLNKDAGTNNITQSTAIGNRVVENFGDFVEARYNTATDSVNGTVYNFVKETSTAAGSAGTEFQKNDLITFAGNVKGNTVFGTAIAKATVNGVNQQGDLKASFFGENAQELAGNITSTTQQDVYSNTKWGSVFGAQRTIVTPPTVTGGNVQDVDFIILNNGNTTVTP